MGAQSGEVARNCLNPGDDVSDVTGHMDFPGSPSSAPPDPTYLLHICRPSCAECSGHCCFGCAGGFKQDSVNTWLADACQAGARILTGGVHASCRGLLLWRCRPAVACQAAAVVACWPFCCSRCWSTECGTCHCRCVWGAHPHRHQRQPPASKQRGEGTRARPASGRCAVQGGPPSSAAEARSTGPPGHLQLRQHPHPRPAAQVMMCWGMDWVQPMWWLEMQVLAA